MAIFFGLIPVLAMAFWARGRFDGWIQAGRDEPRAKELRRGVGMLVLSSVVMLGGLWAAAGMAAPKGTDGGLREAFGLGIAVLAATLFVLFQARGAAHLVAAQGRRA